MQAREALSRIDFAEENSRGLLPRNLSVVVPEEFKLSGEKFYISEEFFHIKKF